MATTSLSLGSTGKPLLKTKCPVAAMARQAKSVEMLYAIQKNIKVNWTLYVLIYRKANYKLNAVSLSDSEFKQVLYALEKGNVFDKAKSLCARLQITRDDQGSAYI